MISNTAAENRFKELFFPLLLFFSLLDGARLLEGKHVAGVPFNVNISDVGMFVCLVLYMGLFSKEIIAALPRSVVILVLVMAFMAVTLAGGFFANPYWMISLKYWIKIYVMFGLLVILFRTSTISKAMIYLFCGIIVFLNLVGILEYCYPKTQSMQDFLVIFRTPESLEGSSAVSSIFVNQNIYGVLNSLFLIAFMAIHFNYRHLIDKAFLFSAIMLCSVGMFLSTSRNALFTALTGLLFLAFPVLKKGRGLKSLLVVTSIVVVSFVVSMSVIPNYANRFGKTLTILSRLIVHQAVTLGDLEINVSKVIPARVSCWKTGIEQAMERPLLGWGNCMAYFHLKPVTKLDHLHNAFLEILYSNGTIGFALFLALIALWLAKLRSVWCWAPVAATLFMSLFETFFVIAPWVVFTAWLVAFTTRDLTENRNDSSGEDLQSPQDEGRQL